jgi:di/tricarboxylate transporter
MAILSIIVGCVAVVFAFVAESFYPADLYGNSPSRTPLPKWRGRTLFVSIGLFMIVRGIAEWINDSSTSKDSPSIHFSW